MDIVLENLRKMGIDYSINKAKPSDVNLAEEKNNEKLIIWNYEKKINCLMFNIIKLINKKNLI